MTNSTLTSDIKLVVIVQRFVDESLLGYLIRLGEANGYRSPTTILKLLERQTGRSVKVLAEIAADLILIEALEILVDAPTSSLTACAWHAIDSASGSYFNVRGAPVPIDALMTSHAQVCPLCLAEGGYLKEDWELSGVTVCPDHSVVLVDRCSACDKFIELLRSPLTNCSHCQFDLRRSTTGSATPNEVNLAEYLLALAPYRLRQGTEDNSDHAESLFGLGQALSFGTKEVLDGHWKQRHFQLLSVEDRRKALWSVALALEGHAIDGLQVHKALLAHVAHRLPYLPHALALQPLVAFMEVNSFLSPRAHRLLSYGDGNARKPTAAEVFGGHPPQFHQDVEVMAFLQCTETAWKWLLKHGFVHIPSKELGFDADEILSAQQRLACLVSLDEMDRRFGVPNLTQCLIDWHVLTLATSPRDSWSAVDLTGVGQILDRLRLLGSNDLVVENQGWSRVCESALAKVDLAEAYSMLIARALRADVVGFRWDTPYSFSDLYVTTADAERLDTA